MLDVIGAMVLTALAATATGTLVLASPVGTLAARRLALGTAAWFTVLAALAAAGLFSAASGIDTPAIGAAVLLPILAVALVTLRVPAARRLALGIPLAVLVVVNVGRLLGGFFLLLQADGRLPATFATHAGWGDVAVAVTALPVAWAVHCRLAGWRALTLVWNSAGLVDLVAAVTLGIGSSASPLRFIYESPDSGVMGTLPWLLVPGFLVPVYVLTHLAVFAQLAAADRGRASGP
jgi:hypothetical protein